MNEYDHTDPDEAVQAHQPKTRRTLSKRARTGWIVAAALTAATIGLAGCAATAATPSPTTTSPSAPAGRGAPGGAGGASNARSGPAAGGSVGTVSGMTTSGFTLSTSGGQTVTIKEKSSTTYADATSPASASAITAGETVLVLGTTDSTTITATQVTVEPGTTTSATASSVVPFAKGSPTTSKQVGRVPANYTEGSGTIVSGTTANKATEAALAAYPGGVVDRVVKLSNGEYEVHNIGVNWPHHVFVSQDFTVLGAD